MLLSLCNGRMALSEVYIKRPIQCGHSLRSSSEHLKQLLYDSDVACIKQLRIDKLTFTKLCSILKTVGQLRDTRNMKVDEQVAIFLHILTHYVKNRVVKVRL